MFGVALFLFARRLFYWLCFIIRRQQNGAGLASTTALTWRASSRLIVYL